jgi:hypothetical protein
MTQTIMAIAPYVESDVTAGDRAVLQALEAVLIVQALRRPAGRIQHVGLMSPTCRLTRRLVVEIVASRSGAA